MATSISCALALPWTPMNLHMRSAHPRDLLPATIHFTQLPPNDSSSAHVISPLQLCLVSLGALISSSVHSITLSLGLLKQLIQIDLVISSQRFVIYFIPCIKKKSLNV